MDKSKIKDILKNAIKSKSTVKVKIKHALGDTLEIDFDPYIVGAT